ncbi:MAG: HlyD family efflux transporter periplasmic adaptor subunit [Planctomycetota bacterium]|nr:MAG: HlyD family efflux transporter periplasmic adaptor subunit [Planctomycetota bacterium]
MPVSSNSNSSGNDRWRRVLGALISLTAILSALVCIIVAWQQLQRYPRTDDAYVRANTIGMAPRVFGQIVELPIVDNQFVAAGTLLYRIDARPYEVALARANAALLLVEFDVRALNDAIAVAAADVLTTRAQIARSESLVAERESQVTAARARMDYAADYLSRIKPLLIKQFVTADRVALAQSELDAARADVAAAQASVANAAAAVVAAAAEVVSAQAREQQARNELGQVGDVNARLEAAAVEVADAQLNMQYCEVRAPLDGWVTNLNTNLGEFVKVGDTLFSIVQNSQWWVMANFLETEIEQIKVGQEVAVYVYAYPGHRFKGTVQGIGWALYQANGATADSLPDVKPTLNWIRLAQRFPVRITLEPFDAKYPFRMGATVTAIVKTDGRDPMLEQLGLLGSPFDARAAEFPPSDAAAPVR